MACHAREQIVPCLLLVLALLCASCIRTWDEEQPRIGDVRHLCTHPTYPGALAQSGAFSVPYMRPFALWIFGETLIETEGEIGFRVVTNSAGMLETLGDPCASEFIWLTDSTSELSPIVSSTADELAFNDTSSSGAYRLWPLGGVSDGGDVYLYVNKVLFRDYFDYDVVSTFLWKQTAQGEQVRSIEWTGSESGWGTGAFLDKDVTVYLFRTVKNDGFAWDVQLARVPVAGIENSSAYEYFDGFDWSSSPAPSVTVMETSPQLSVAYNSYLERYVAVYPEPLGSRVMMRIAEQIDSEWSDPIALFDVDLGEQMFLGNVYQHPDYARDGGRTILISHEPGLQLAEFRFEVDK